MKNQTFYLYQHPTDYTYIITDEKKDLNVFGHCIIESEENKTLNHFIGDLIKRGYLERLEINVSNVCKKCNGNMIPSKAFMNYHNIQGQKPEFETKLENCLKCESCGHSYIPANKMVENKSVDIQAANTTLETVIIYLRKHIPAMNEEVKNLEQCWKLLGENPSFAHKLSKELKKLNN